MIFTLLKIKEKSAILFLGIFLSFLVQSFSHSHDINIIVNASSSIHTENTHSETDPFLDSSLNCTIHSFNNSIGFENLIIPLEDVKSYSTFAVFEYQSFYYNSFFYNTNQLRAPPIA
ncbi:MAG: hypothetical protein WAR79_13850 [Melioribacteraceae bacterium]